MITLITQHFVHNPPRCLAAIANPVPRTKDPAWVSIGMAVAVLLAAAMRLLHNSVSQMHSSYLKMFCRLL